MKPFKNRRDGGRKLAEHVRGHYQGDNLMVQGLPRGGVPVALEVAKALGAPLDVFIVRKLGLPFQDELAMGALANGGVKILNQKLIALRKLDPEKIVVAVPVTPVDTAQKIRELADDLRWVSMPEPFYGVGRWYGDFDQTEDQEVLEILTQSTENRARSWRGGYENRATGAGQLL